MTILHRMQAAVLALALVGQVMVPAGLVLADESVTPDPVVSTDVAAPADQTTTDTQPETKTEAPAQPAVADVALASDMARTALQTADQNFNDQVSVVVNSVTPTTDHACVPPFADVVSIVVTVTNNGDTPIYNPTAQIMQLEYAVPGSKADELRVLTADDSTDCATGGLVDSLQTFGPYGTTIAPQGSIQETFEIGRSRTDTFRFRFGLLGNSELTPVTVEPVCSVSPNTIRYWKLTSQTGDAVNILYGVDTDPEQAATVPAEGNLILSGAVTQDSENVLFIRNTPDSQYTFRSKNLATDAVCPSVQGYKFNDVNGNGIWDESETGLANWRIIATGTTPVAIIDVSANEIDGATANLPAGEYVFEVSGQWSFDGNESHTVDAEYVSVDGFTTHRDGTGIAGNPGYTQGDLLVNNNDVYWGGYRADHTYTHYFNQAESGDVNFQIWDSPDRNAEPNGAWYADNTGELTVTIYRAVNASVLTSSNPQLLGYYNIAVPYGTSVVNIYEANQSGFVNTAPESGFYSDVAVNADTAQMFHNFGNQAIATGAISGSVKQTPAVALAGAVVYIDANSNGVKDAEELSFTTGTDGLYGFNNLVDGDYRVAIQGISGLTFTTPSTGFSDVSISEGQIITDVNFTLSASTSGGGDQGGGGGGTPPPSGGGGSGGGGSQGGGGSSGGGSTGGGSTGGSGGSTTPPVTPPSDGGGITIPAPTAGETPAGQVAGDTTTIKTPTRLAVNAPAPEQPTDLQVKTDEGQVLGVTTGTPEQPNCQQLPWWRYGYLLYALLLLLVARFFATNLSSKVWFVPGVVLLAAGLVYWWFEPCVQHTWFWPTAIVVWYAITAFWHRNRLQAK